MFKLIAQKFINPNSENLSNLTGDELKKRGQQLKREEIKDQNKKKEIINLKIKNKNAKHS